MALVRARNASPWLLVCFRDFEPPEHVPRTSARAHTLRRVVRAGSLHVPEPRTREKTPWPEDKKMPTCKKPHIYTHILIVRVIYMHSPARCRVGPLYQLHHLAHISWVGSVLCRSCTNNLSQRQVKELNDLDHDLCPHQHQRGSYY